MKEERVKGRVVERDARRIVMEGRNKLRNDGKKMEEKRENGNKENEETKNKRKWKRM